MSFPFKLSNGFSFNYTVLKHGINVTGTQTIGEFLALYCKGAPGSIFTESDMEDIVAIFGNDFSAYAGDTTNFPVKVRYVGSSPNFLYCHAGMSVVDTNVFAAMGVTIRGGSAIPALVLKPGVEEITMPPTYNTLNQEIDSVGHLLIDLPDIVSRYNSTSSRTDALRRLAAAYPLGYTINFVVNGGTPVPTLESQTNLPDPLPTTTREGYIFTGWYTDSSLIFPAIPGAAITEDTTLYAGWRPAEFIITFNTNGGEPIGQLTKQNHLPDPLPIPIKTGNTFVGWFKDSALLIPAVPGSPISQNTTLYAKWEEIQSTDIHVPAVNTPSLLQSGFVTMWQPTLEEVRALSSFLWTTNIFDNLRKLFNDPMEALLFLGIIPFDPTTSERGNIYFGNLDSEVESTPIVQQYYTLDFGDINLSEYYNSFLDYSPNTYAEIFLPFCGTHRLSINEIMGATINVKYNVDVFTGTCLAMLTITKPGLDSVMYSFEGNLMATIPVTAKNYSDLYRRTITGIASIAATAVLGGVI